MSSCDSRESRDNDEKLLSVEAEAAVREISFTVDHVSVSTCLPNNNELVYLNIKTKEKKIMCVELTIAGFRIVGSEFDKPDNPIVSKTYYETIYQLLDENSEQYRLSFGMALSQKLSQLGTYSPNSGTSPAGGSPITSPSGLF